MVTPISPKRGLYKLLALDYFMIAGFYLLLGFTGMFAFPHLEDLYTLNFVPNRCPSDPASNFTASILDAVMPKGLKYYIYRIPIEMTNFCFHMLTIK